MTLGRGSALLCIVAALSSLALPASVGGSPGALSTSTERHPPPEGCLNLAIAEWSPGFDVYVSYDGVIGVTLSTGEPAPERTLSLYVIPELCRDGSLLSTSYGHEPPRRPPPGRSVSAEARDLVEAILP